VARSSDCRGRTTKTIALWIWVALLAPVAELPRIPDGTTAGHPAVLVHDPPPARNGATPVRVCGVTGYLGSA
jgi:hypothetical protein